jgi:hypothetical protein
MAIETSKQGIGKMNVKSKWNEWRGDTAGQAVEFFANLTGGDIEAERDDMVADLLCNLGHYCNAHGLDWETLVSRARLNIAHEQKYGDEEYGGVGP